MLTSVERLRTNPAVVKKPSTQAPVAPTFLSAGFRTFQFRGVLDFRFSAFRFPLSFVILSSASLTHHPPPSSFPPMSRLPFELLLALRYLRPKRTFVSVITLISVVGVTVGVWVLIIVISVMSGFDQQLREKILGFNSHIKIFKREASPLDNYKEVMRVV